MTVPPSSLLCLSTTSFHRRPHPICLAVRAQTNECISRRVYRKVSHKVRFDQAASSIGRSNKPAVPSFRIHTTQQQLIFFADWMWAKAKGASRRRYYATTTTLPHRLCLVSASRGEEGLRVARLYICMRHFCWWEATALSSISVLSPAYRYYSSRLIGSLREQESPHLSTYVIPFSAPRPTESRL